MTARGIVLEHLQTGERGSVGQIAVRVGLSPQLVNAALMALPMNVPSEAWMPRFAKTGLRNFISSITIGNKPSSTSMAAFQFGGPSPVIGSIGTQPGKAVASRISSSLSINSLVSARSALRSRAFIQTSRCSAES